MAFRLSSEPDTPVACRSDDFMPFGKHKGKMIGAVEQDYMGWLVRQDWLRERWPRLFWWCVVHRDRFSGESAEILSAAYEELDGIDIRTESVNLKNRNDIVAGVGDMAHVITHMVKIFNSVSRDLLIEALYTDPRYQRAARALMKDRIREYTFEALWEALDTRGKERLIQLAMLSRSDDTYLESLKRRKVSIEPDIEDMSGGYDRPRDNEGFHDWMDRIAPVDEDDDIPF